MTFSYGSPKGNPLSLTLSHWERDFLIRKR